MSIFCGVGGCWLGGMAGGWWWWASLQPTVLYPLKAIDPSDYTAPLCTLTRADTFG